MANELIRPSALPARANPVATEVVPSDNGSEVAAVTWADGVNAGRPLANQSEAEGGVQATKAMTPLTTKQAITAQVPTIVSGAIGALNLGTMSQEDATDYTPTSGLAAVALSNDYGNLDNLPTLGTAAATDASDYAVAARGLPPGGSGGQILAKDSSSDYDVTWISGSGSGDLLAANNLSDVASASTSRTNLGLVAIAASGSATDITDSTSVGRAVLTAADAAAARAAIYAAPFDAVAFSGLQVNGSMEIAQDNGSTAVTGITAGSSYIVDGHLIRIQGAGVVTGQQVTDAPAGYTNSLQINVTTADNSLAGSDYCCVSFFVEGLRAARLAFGTASAKPISIGFWIKANRTGTYGGAVRNSAVNRSYIFSFVISSANTWEYKTVTITGDQSGTWLNDTGIGMEVSITLAAVAGLQGTPGAWSGSNLVGATGQTNGIAATSDVFNITGIVVLPGIELPSASAAPLIMRPRDTEIYLCFRRLLRAPVFAGVGVGQSSGQVARFTSPFSVRMRVTPTTTLGQGASGLGFFDGTNARQYNGGTVTVYSTPDYFQADIVTNGSFVADSAVVPYAAGANSFIRHNAQF